MSPQETIQIAKNQSAHSATRRVIPRHHKRLMVKYIHSGKTERALKGYSKDVGAMGLHIQSNRRERIGNKVCVEVNVPNSGPVRMEGVVCWTKWVPNGLRAVASSGFGIRITNAPEAWFSYCMSLDKAA